MKQKKHVGKRLLAGLLGAVLLQTAVSIPSGLQASAADEVEYNYAKALQYSIYFYDGNMCGTEVAENNRYQWRGNCHTYDAQVPLQPMGEDKVGTNLSQSFIDQYRDILDPDGDGYVDVSGGFHDAGDHVKFGMPENYAASTLGWGYYEFRDSYKKTGQDDHIETILRYFNDYLMKCTFRDENGEVVAHCYQVGDGDIDHAYWNSPEVDTMARPAFFLTGDKPQTDYVASAAASLAINYLNFKDTDPDYAAQSLDYAKALFQFAKSHEKQLSDNADGPKSYYVSSKWEDDYCWAAAWLFKITGDESYLQEIYPYYDYYAAPCYVYCWNDMWNGVQCILGEISEDKPAKEGEHVYPQFIEKYKEAAEKSPYEEMDCWASVAKAITTYMTGGVGTITPAGYFWLNTWGSARYNTAAQLCALVYDKYNNNGKPSEYSEWAKEQMQYLMGNNPMNRAYIVGYSENAAKYPHHRAASGLTRAEDTREQRHVLYGALVGGPDASDKHNDITADWIYNEVTIDYNAAFVGASAGLYAYFGDDSMQVTPDFPPKEENNGEEGGGNNYWVEAFAVNNPCAGGAGTTKISMKVMTDSITPRTDVTVRYFFNTKEMTNPSLVQATELYDQAATEAAPADGVISGPFQYDASYDPNIYYFEVAWDGYTIANSNKKYQCSVGLYYGDQWDASNDWSYQDLPVLTDSEMFGDGNEVKSDYICVYAGGELVGGTEPNGSTPKPAETTTTSTTTATTTTTTTTTVTNATTTESEVSTTSATEVTTTESKPATTTSLTEATTTESTTTATTEAGAEIYYGDVNQDGVVDLADAIVMNKALANVITLSESAGKCADCYDDGILDDKDATILMRFVIGKINDVPSKEL